MLGSHPMPAAGLASAEYLFFSGDAATRCPGPLGLLPGRSGGAAGMEALPFERPCAMAPGRARS